MRHQHAVHNVILLVNRFELSDYFHGLATLFSAATSGKVLALLAQERARVIWAPTIYNWGVMTTRATENHNSEASASYRYIVRSPDVRGGSARVESTRVAVHDVIGLLQNGETVDSLTVNCLPMLTKAQVYECLAYYEDHRGEIDLLVARQMAHDQQ